MAEPKKSRQSRTPAAAPADPPLAVERDLLAAILDTAGALILLLDAEGRVLRFNRACENATGFSAAEVMGRYYWEILIAEAEREDVQRFLLSLGPTSFPETHERAWVTRTGSRRLIRWRSTALMNDQAKIEYIIATGFDITEIRQAEQVLQQRTHALGERMKELRLLYAISSLREDRKLSLEQMLQCVAQETPAAWQFPDIACSRITIGGQSSVSQGFVETAWRQASTITYDNEPIGIVEVFYREEMPPAAEGPFLAEERNLIDDIAERVGQIVGDQRSAQRITEYQSQLRYLASELALIEERERRRIAQELHDQVGHTLASVKFKLGELADRSPDKAIEDALLLLEQAIQASRNLTFELSPPVLHELGLGAALEWLVHQLRANYGIAGEYMDDRQPKPLTEDLRVVLFQAVRELLVNVGKHSRASLAQVRAQVEDGNLVIVVEDDGVGFDPALLRPKPGVVRGFGLFSIRERLAHLGGRMTVDSTLGLGTRVTLATPLASQEQATSSSLPQTIPVEGVKPLRRRIKIVLADDQALTRAGLRSLLEKHTDMEVVSEAKDGEAAVQAAAEHMADVVVMDIAMPIVNGIEATKRILAARPETKVIALSMHADGQYVLEMLRAGAAGYLLKDCAQEDLAQAIRMVDANLTFLSPGIADRVVQDYVRSRSAHDSAGQVQSLTEREREVLKLLAGGMQTKEIALAIEVSVKTVEAHRQHIMEKLGTRSIADLTKVAIREGLIELESGE